MARLTPTACRRCGVVEPMRQNLTKRGYHLECANEVMAEALRSMAYRTGDVWRRKLVNQIAALQRQLDEHDAAEALRRSRRVVPSGRRVGDGPRRPAA